jgi:general nucleoside transport system ATP-binding protein
MSQDAFSFSEVSKYFGELCANSSVSFSVADRSIHGVVGENGAGKSTIMKVLYGLYKATSGTVKVRGNEVQFRSPQEAIAAGIGMVHQHFMLVPTLTVWENVILGHEPHAWRSNRATSLQKLSQIQAAFGFQLDLESRVETLPVGLQQQVEILKLLYREAQILIFDEPTAVLTPQEVDVLIDRLRGLRDQGKTIVFISHKLREILALTDNVTVLRQGKVVGTWPTRELTEESLAETMIGRKRHALPERRTPQNTEPALQAKGLSLRTGKRSVLNGLDFGVRQGEIVGVAGVDGNGQQEWIEILSRVRSDYTGSLQWLSKEYRDLPTYDFKQNGLAVIPPDRHHEAVVLDFSLSENVLLGHHFENDFSKHGKLNWPEVDRLTQSLIARFDIRPPVARARMGGLSGGNQQKLVVARELSRKVQLLIAAHPTRGVDIGAIECIHREILQLRDAGCAVVLFSSELDEILALSDSIVVIYNGQIQGQCRRAEATERQIGLWMTGGGK